MLGKPASLFVVSGVMAQQIALKVHEGRAGKGSVVACHPNSHLLLHECDGPAVLMGFRFVTVGDMHRALTADDLASAHASGALAGCFALVVELGQRYNGGAVPSWEELLRIRAWCDSVGIILHMDGARLVR